MQPLRTGLRCRIDILILWAFCIVYPFNKILFIFFNFCTNCLSTLLDNGSGIVAGNFCKIRSKEAAPMLILFVKVCHSHLFRRDLEKATQ